MTEKDEQGGTARSAYATYGGQTFDTQLALSQHLMDVHEDDMLRSDPAE